MSKALCLIHWRTRTEIDKQKQHMLALSNIFLPIKSHVGQTIKGKNNLAHFKEHGMFIVKRQPEQRGRQMINIA